MCIYIYISLYIYIYIYIRVAVLWRPWSLISCSGLRMPCRLWATRVSCCRLLWCMPACWYGLMWRVHSYMPICVLCACYVCIHIYVYVYIYIHMYDSMHICYIQVYTAVATTITNSNTYVYHAHRLVHCCCYLQPLLMLCDVHLVCDWPHSTRSVPGCAVECACGASSSGRNPASRMVNQWDLDCAKHRLKCHGDLYT